MEHVPPPPPPNKPKTSTWLPTSITSGFKARTKPRSLLSLAKWFNNTRHYDLIVAATTDLTRATDPQCHFKCHQFVINTRSAALLKALLSHQIGLHNGVPVVYLPELLDKPDLLGYLLQLCYDDLLIEQEDKFHALADLYKRYDMSTLLYALDPQLLSDTQRTRHSQLLASDLTRVTPQIDHVTRFSDTRVTIEGVEGTYHCHWIVLLSIATIFESRDSEGRYTWVIRARDIHLLLGGQEAMLLPCVDALIKYFYSGSLTLNGLNSEQLIGLALIAAHYSLTDVKERCESRLTSHVTAENACQLLITCHHYQQTHLQNQVLQVICSDIPQMINSPDFMNMPRHLLRDYRSGPLNVFHCCLNSYSSGRALTQLREFLGADAVPLLTAVIDGATLLHRAFVLERMDACQVLIDMHVIDLEARNNQGDTLLQLMLNSRRTPLTLLCSLLNAGVNVDYLNGRELLRLLAFIPKLRHSNATEHGALKRLRALYYQHHEQPWMNALWTEDCVLRALESNNFDCVGLLWTHFNQPLQHHTTKINNHTRVLDGHHIALTINGNEHVLDMRTVEFSLEEKWVWYGFIDDCEYTLHITSDGQQLSINDVNLYHNSDAFVNLLKFMFIINRAAPEQYDDLFATSFNKLIKLKLPSTYDTEHTALEDYFVNKCNIQ